MVTAQLVPPNRDAPYVTRTPNRPEETDTCAQAYPAKTLAEGEHGTRYLLFLQ